MRKVWWGAVAAALLQAASSFAQMPAPDGDVIWGGYTQNQLDAAYDQNFWDNSPPATGARNGSNAVRARYGEPDRVAYGPSQHELLDIYRAPRAGRSAPIMIYIHGGAWRGGSARSSATQAEMFMEAGAHFIALDFVNTLQNGGNLMQMAEQVRRAVGWVYRNAHYVGGDAKRIYVSGHSSGGHLCGVVVTTDWSELDLPWDIVKGAVCSSGMYELYPVSLSARRLYVNFTQETIEKLSPIRHLDRLNAPLVIGHGTVESPEFIRQSQEFVAALRAAGKEVTYIVGVGYNHFEFPETYANPYGHLGRAALELMGLQPNRGFKH